ncbi:tyrosine-type recombinase/integrase [Undibacterium sp. Xuan67W]|uniref:tyrosine-type recombinase/integrase n=1 Tax=Undibacterium sp. Xuan67W TaxID=3413057 RepID=UPI003BEFF728
MQIKLTKKDIEKMEGEAGQVVRVRHGSTRLFLRIDRRTEGKISKTWHFEREFAGRKIRTRIGLFPEMPVGQAEQKATALDAECNVGNDPRILAKTKKAAIQAEAIKKRAGTITLREVWNAYLDSRASDIRPLKPLTVRDYRKHLDKTFVTWANKPIRQITKESIKASYRVLIARLGVAQANQAMRSIRAVLNWMLKNDEFLGAITENPVEVLTGKMHEINERIRCLERGQIDSWWAASAELENETARTYLRFLLLTGARREEALSLKWANVDLRWNSCTFVDTKNGDDRCIPLTVEVRAMLATLPQSSDWVFASETSKSGRMVEPAKHIDRIEKITGIRLSSHDLRRSFTTLAEWAELPDGAVKQIIGHKPGGVTEQHYKRRPLDMLRMLLQRYEDFILSEIANNDAPLATVTQLDNERSTTVQRPFNHKGN